MKNIILVLSVLCFTTVAPAQEQVDAPAASAEAATEKAEQVTNKVLNAYRTAGEKARASRETNNVTVLLNYSNLDLLLPSKSGATLAWHHHHDRLYELEYLSSSVSTPYTLSDLASMSETRISLHKRNFASGGTFNWFWGLTYNRSQVEVSPELMASLGQPVSSMLDVESLGLDIGVGNRWVVYKDISVAVDWFSWSQPLYSLKKSSPYLDYAGNPDDRDKVDTLLNLMQYFPRWAALKLSIGYSF